eukprot:5316021-Prymnesium_polylepis.1
MIAGRGDRRVQLRDDHLLAGGRELPPARSHGDGHEPRSSLGARSDERPGSVRIPSARKAAVQSQRFECQRFEARRTRRPSSRRRAGAPTAPGHTPRSSSRTGRRQSASPSSRRAAPE